MADGNCGGPTLIEYARYHGLATDHHGYDLFSELRTVTDHELVLSADNYTELPDFVPPPFDDVLASPKFQINGRERMLLVGSVTEPPSPNWQDVLPDPHRIHNLKLDSPLLEADRTADMRSCAERPSLDFEDLSMLPEPVDEENDEGTGWPTRYLNLAVEWDARLDREKLTTTKEALMLLQTSLQDLYTPKLYEAVLKDSLSYQRARSKARTESLSPPLLPYADEPEPFIPPLPGLGPSLCSDPADPGSPATQKFEQYLIDCDRIDNKGFEANQAKKIAEPLHQANNGIPMDIPIGHVVDKSCPSSRKNAHSLKLESPLLPANTVEEVRPGVLKVSFAEDLEEFSPDLLEADRVLRVPDSAAEKVDKMIAGENFRPVEIGMRIEVPKVRQIETTAPWHAVGSINEGKALSDSLDGLSIDQSEFDGKPIDLELNWIPFATKFATVDLKESIEDDGYLEKLLDSPGEVIASSQMLWKPDGLRLFDSCAESDEEDLEVNPGLQELSNHKPHISPLPRKRPRMDALVHAHVTPQASHATSHNAFTTTESLSKFMSTRGSYRKRPKVTDTHNFPDTTRSHRNATTGPQNDAHSQNEIQVPATPAKELMEVSDLWSTKSSDCHQPHTIVLNSALLQNQRDMIRYLETRFKTMTIIYRDLDGRGESSGMRPGRLHAAPDMILSPITALIYTTLQATTQRSLPGQAVLRSPVHERVSDLAELFDNVFVLVSYPTATGELDENACASISDFVAFAASLSPLAAVNVIVLPSRESACENSYVGCTAALIAKHGFHDVNGVVTQCFIQDETLWELFLRQAGLNPFAAQVVLGMLKKPDGQLTMTDITHGKRLIPVSKAWGLRAFVQMLSEQKMAMFGGLIGYRAVERVNRALDTQWSPGVAAVFDEQLLGDDEYSDVFF